MPRDIEWSDEQDIQKRISEFDVGIATLLDNELHRSKSAFKLKQYLNNGAPVLSSDLPENNFFLLDGINGFLCATPEEFGKRLTALHELSDADYLKLSMKARQSASSFNMTTYCETLLTGKGQSFHKKPALKMNELVTGKTSIPQPVASI